MRKSPQKITAKYNLDKRGDGSEVIQRKGLEKVVVCRERSHLENQKPHKRSDSRHNNREGLG
jgi:hypothetical protein